MPTGRIFLDTEFTDLPWTGRSHLLWLGLVDDADRRWSACAATEAAPCSDFVRERVISLIPAEEPRLTRAELASEAVRFCGDVEEFWAWFPSLDDIVNLGIPTSKASEVLRRYADWDHQLLTSLVGHPPQAWPERCHDVHDLARRAGIELPTNPRPHHPAYDAAWNREVYLRATAVLDERVWPANEPRGQRTNRPRRGLLFHANSRSVTPLTQEISLMRLVLV